MIAYIYISYNLKTEIISTTVASALPTITVTLNTTTTTATHILASIDDTTITAIAAITVSPLSARD